MIQSIQQLAAQWAAAVASQNMHQKLGQSQQARFYYQQALNKTTQQAEQRFLQKKLQTLG